MRDEGQRIQFHRLQPHYQAPNNSCSRQAMPRHDCQCVDSGNSLTALYHKRWPMTCRKPGTIFLPTILEIFPPMFFCLPSPSLAGLRNPRRRARLVRARRQGSGQTARPRTLASTKTATLSFGPRRKPSPSSLSWKGTATSLTGLRHRPHGWPG